MTTTLLRLPTYSTLTPRKPVIGIVGKGPKAYLWVGDEGDGACFGTLSGTKTMRNFLDALSTVTRKQK